MAESYLKQEKRNNYPFKCGRQTNVAVCGDLFTVIFTHR